VSPLEVEHRDTRQVRRILCKPPSARCRSLECIDLAQLEDVETLAQPGSPARAGFARVGVECNRRLLWEEIGLAENAVQSDLLTSRERMAYIFS
jgi:hypothetical protein